MKYMLLLVFAVACCSGFAQSCKYFPADCPETRADPYGSPEDSVSRLDNPVLPLEVTMENRLRTKVTDWMNRLAAKEGWEVVQLSEDLASGERDGAGNVLAYAQRPPHWMVFRFQFVVNADSLAAWGKWFQEFAQRRLDNARSGKSDNGFEAERNRQRTHFRDAALLVVEIGFNENFAKTIEGATLPQVVAAPIWMANGKPDPIAVDLMNRSRNCMLLLRGDWKRSAMGGGYAATFAKDKKCDQVQTTSITCSGNAAAVRRFVAGLPTGEFDGLLAR
jgi:hypothetical protein